MTSATPTTPRPQDDLFRHVNGQWLATARIADDRSSAGSFVDLDENAMADVRAIIEGLDPADDGEPGKVAALWAAYLDTDTLDALGAKPLVPLLARVDAIDSLDALAAHWGWSLRHQVAAPLAFFIDADMDDPSRYTAIFWQSGTGLPDREYYWADEHAPLRERYLAHVTRSLELADVADADAQASLVLDLETEVARRQWDRVHVRDLQARHNPMSWQAFRDSAEALHLDTVLEHAELTPDDLPRLLVAMPSFFVDLQDLFVDERLEAWRAWSRWAVVRSLAPYLSSDFVEERFDFYGRTLQGTPSLAPRWKRGVDLVESVMGEAIGRLYVERHFPPSSKAQVDALVANLLAAYRQSISALDWMGDETRAEALHKLDGFRTKIGYPSHWRDYSGLDVVPGDLVASMLASARFDVDYMVSRLQQPVDPDEWLMLPQTVNAYYHPQRNEIVFPAAILQPPFFDPQAPMATNYGGIGSVIGHEIGHGFDDQGSTCDGDGRLRNWWTDEDRAAFECRKDALIAQFDRLTPRQLADDDPRPHVNGSLTIGENIGDLGGLTIALKALAIALGRTPDTDELQALFTGYATIWCGINRDERARQLLVIDPHSPAEFRCNQIASNLDAFHQAYATAPGDGMWLDPAERVSIW